MTDTTRRSFRLTRRTPDPDGASMTLTGHLKELRNRLVISAIFIVLGTVVGLIFYKSLFNFLAHPYEVAVNKIIAKDPDSTATPILALDGIAAPLIFQLQIAFVAGIVIASPVWLYQLWSFITPGLHHHERKWTFTFLGTAVPLFFAGAGLAFWVLPKGITLLLGFTPENVTNINHLNDYLSFVMRMLLVFGLAYYLPLFLVLLNLAGMVTGKKLSNLRRGIVFGIFVFAAVATPTGDPITMLLLAVPVWLLFEISVIICRVHDKRKGITTEPAYEQWSDDEASPI
jgi:sec-independent protein translocase protein TatC